MRELLECESVDTAVGKSNTFRCYCLRNLEVPTFIIQHEFTVCYLVIPIGIITALLIEVEEVSYILLGM